MVCDACGSDGKCEFTGEVAIHFQGLKGLEMPIVWVFPKVLVCLNCGLAQFQIPEEDLRTLEDPVATSPT